jgi:uncharacterized protein (TIGR02996 family)
MAISRPEVIAFLQAIKDEPDDDTPRLVLADWLEERGDPRSELLRVQVELARLPADAPQFRMLVPREQRLLREHADTWLGPLARLVSGWKPERGLWRVFLTPASFLRPELGTDEAREPLAWVDSVRLFQWHAGSSEASVLAALAASPRLADLNRLSLGAAGIGDVGLQVLAASPHLHRLTHLNLRGNDIGDAGVAALAEAALPSLRLLEMGGNAFTSAGRALLQRRFGDRVVL